MADSNVTVPVLTLFNNRIRNLRKKLGRIDQLEKSIAQGKSCINNQEQQDLVASKPSILAVIAELEKFQQPLSVAVDKVINLEKKSVLAPIDERICNLKKILNQTDEVAPKPSINAVVFDELKKFRELLSITLDKEINLALTTLGNEENETAPLKNEAEAENSIEFPAQTEPTETNAGGAEYQEQDVHWRSYHRQRGIRPGGRRGYGIGRVGRSDGIGGRNQYNE